MDSTTTLSCSQKKNKYDEIVEKALIEDKEIACVNCEKIFHLIPINGKHFICADCFNDDTNSSSYFFCGICGIEEKSFPSNGVITCKECFDTCFDTCV